MGGPSIQLSGDGWPTHTRGAVPWPADRPLTEDISPTPGPAGIGAPAGTAAAKAPAQGRPPGRASGTTRRRAELGGLAGTGARGVAHAKSQVKTRTRPQDAQSAGAGEAAGQAAVQAKAVANPSAAIPWYERAQRTNSAPGQRHCGLLEKILHRQWAADQLPPPQIVLAVDRLAEFPQLLKERLVAGLDAIYVGPGGVPDLDDLGSLSGLPLPSGRATWDACAGAYGARKVIVGSRPSPTPDVMCHEIGHALDDIDGADGSWQSDSTDFARLYSQCRPWMNTDLHRQPGHLGRREFFADAFAAIASSQRPALLEMLGGNTRVALNVMLYFSVRYGI